jgi:hypothetical protein
MQFAVLLSPVPRAAQLPLTHRAIRFLPLVNVNAPHTCKTPDGLNAIPVT